MKKALLSILFLLVILPGAALGAFPTTAVIENCNDTEGPPMTNWTDAYNGLQSNGSNCLSSVNGDYSVSYYSALGDQTDMEAYLTLATVDSTDCYIGVRMQEPNEHGYYVAIDAAGSTVSLWEGQAGPDAQLGSNVSHTWVNGDVVGISAIGTTIKVYLNGVEVISQTDATWASGRIWISANSDTWRFDSIGGGAYVPPTGKRKIVLTQ